MEKRYHTARGFTLIELMIVLAVGLVLTLAMVSVYVNTKRNHVQNEQFSAMHENAGFAMRMLAQDLKSLGYLGRVIDSSLVSLDDTLALTQDCGLAADDDWAYDVGSFGYLQHVNDATAADAHTAHDCIAEADVEADNDLVTVRRVKGETHTGALQDKTVYVRSNNVSACLWLYVNGTKDAPTGGSCPTADFEDWPYIASVYFVRPYAEEADDGIPTLCRKSLVVPTGTSTPTMDTVCLAEGVEHFHVEYGLDTDGDGVANQYDSAPTAAEVDSAVSARIYVLAKSPKQDPNYTNTKSYQMGLVTVDKNDNHYRRVYSTTVLLRNNAFAAQL